MVKPEYSTISWRNQEVAYKVFSPENVYVLGFIDNGRVVPVEQKLEKKCRAFLRGVDLHEDVLPRANINFKKMQTN